MYLICSVEIVCRVKIQFALHQLVSFNLNNILRFVCKYQIQCMVPSGGFVYHLREEVDLNKFHKPLICCVRWVDGHCTLFPVKEWHNIRL